MEGGRERGEGGRKRGEGGREEGRRKREKEEEIVMRERGKKELNPLSCNRCSDTIAVGITI